jgi:hypothetical protein
MMRDKLIQEAIDTILKYDKERAVASGKRSA